MQQIFTESPARVPPRCRPGEGRPSPRRSLPGVQVPPFPGSGHHFRGQDRAAARPCGQVARLSVIFQRPVPDPSFGHVLSTQQPALDPGSAVGRTWLLRGAQGKPRGEQRGNAAEGDQEGPPETGTQGQGAERGPAGSRVQGAAPTKAVTPQRLARSRSCARPGVPCAGQKVTLLPPSKSSAGLMTQLT